MDHPRLVALTSLAGVGMGVIAAFVTASPGAGPAPPRPAAALPQPEPQPAPVPVAVVPAVPDPVAAPEAEPVSRAEAPLALSTEQIVERSEASVALVCGSRSSGTGFLIRPGVLVTNAHVIAGEKVAALSVTFPAAKPAARRPAVGALLFEDPVRDLAFLSVDSPLPPLAVDSAYRFRRGQDVTVIGNPGSLLGQTLVNAVSRGVMSTEVVYQGLPFYQIGIAINPGNSGGPVIGSDGRVVGVATLKDPNHEGLAFCIPAAALAQADRRARSRSDRDARAATALHDHGAVIVKLDKLGEAYLKTLALQADALDQFARDGVNTSYVREMMHRGYRENLGDQFDRITNDSLYPEVREAAADPALPPAVRNDLVALWDNFLELRRANERPQGSGRSLRARARELGARHERLVSALRTSLTASGP